MENIPIIEKTDDLSDTSSTSHKSHRSNKNNRIFTHHQKEQCWNKAAIMIGRSPNRWKLDAFGNPVLKALKGCFGALCHEYDHIIPYSKGGKTEIENCQILQTTLNKVKSDRLEIGYPEMRKISPKFDFSENELDAIEKAVYGDVEKNQEFQFTKK